MDDHHEKMGHASSNVGVGQRNDMLEMMRSQQRKQEAIEKERNRIRNLPKCPQCNSPLEVEMTTCRACGLQIIITKYLGQVAKGHHVIPKKSVASFIQKMSTEFIVCQENLLCDADVKLQELLNITQIIFEASKPASPVAEQLSTENIYSKKRMLTKTPAVIRPTLISIGVSVLILTFMFPVLENILPRGNLYFDLSVMATMLVAVAAPFLVFFFFFFFLSRVESENTERKLRDSKDLNEINQKIAKVIHSLNINSKPISIHEISRRIRKIFASFKTNVPWAVLANDHKSLEEVATRFDLTFPALKNRPDISQRLVKKSLPNNFVDLLSANTTYWKKISPVMLKELESWPPFSSNIISEF